MPVYEYSCAAHGRFSAWGLMSERHSPVACGACGVPAPYVISAPRVFSDFVPYVSPATGKMIEGRKARVEDLARSNCRPYEAGEYQDVAVRQAANEAKLDKKIEETVEQTLVELKNA